MSNFIPGNFDNVNTFIDTNPRVPAGLREVIGSSNNGLAQFRRIAKSWYLRSQPALSSPGPYEGEVLMSYRPGHLHNWGPNDVSGRPWIVCHVREAHQGIPRPGRYDPNGSAQQEYLYWVSIYLHHQIGVFLPPQNDREGPVPQPGERVQVYFDNHANPTSGRYVPNNLGSMPSYIPSCGTAAAEPPPTSGIKQPPESGDQAVPPPEDPPDDEAVLWLARMIGIEGTGETELEKFVFMQIAKNRLDADTRQYEYDSYEQVFWGNHEGNEWFGPEHAQQGMPDQDPTPADTELAEKFINEETVPGFNATQLQGYTHFIHVWRFPECSADSVGDIRGRRVCADTEYPVFGAPGRNHVPARVGSARYRYLPTWSVHRQRRNGAARRSPYYVGDTLIS